MHFASFRNLHLTDNRDVILRLASDQTGVATHARGKVDGHAPLVEFVGEEGVSVAVFLLVEGNILGCVGVVALLLDTGKLLIEIALVIDGVRGNLAGKCTAVHRIVLLRQRDGVAFFRAGNCCTSGEIRSCLRAERVGIEATIHTNETDVLSVPIAT